VGCLYSALPERQSSDRSACSIAMSDLSEFMLRKNWPNLVHQLVVLSRTSNDMKEICGGDPYRRA